MAYCFEFLSDDFNFETVDEIVNNFFDQNPHSWPCWAFSNHDATRIASRVNKSPKEIMGKLLSLRGNVCIYQGEELGLRNSILEKKDIRDPFGLNFWPKFKGRDGCRTPLPWNSKQKNYGFSSGKPWLPCDKKFEKLSVDIQENDKNSMLNFTREKISQRKIN